MVGVHKNSVPSRAAQVAAPLPVLPLMHATMYSMQDTTGAVLKLSPGTTAKLTLHGHGGVQYHALGAPKRGARRKRSSRSYGKQHSTLAEAV